MGQIKFFPVIVHEKNKEQFEKLEKMSVSPSGVHMRKSK